MGLESSLRRYYGELADSLRIFRETSAPLERAYAFNFNSFELLIANEQSLLKSFFREVLEKVIKDFVSPQDPDLEKARVRLEYLTSTRRRIDIVIDLPELRLAIENKPWANDGDMQIADYYDFLKRQNKQWVLCYLTPCGQSSESAGKATPEKDYFCLSCQKHMLSWLEACMKDCKADRIRHFIEDFEGYIQAHLRGTEEDGYEQARV